MVPPRAPPLSYHLPLLSIFPEDPPPRSPLNFFHTPPRSATKILPSSGSAAFSDAPVDTAHPVFDPALPPTPPSPSSPDLSDVRDILWNHFGFIPTHPDLLLLDGYKSPPLSSPHSPLHPSSVTATHQRNLSPSTNHSRTSSSPPLPSLPNMAKKRRSLQAILVPSFLPHASASASSPPSRQRSYTVTSPSDLNSVQYSPDWLEFYTGTASPAGTELASLAPVTPSRHSPPPDLLDADPFADLSPAPSLRSSRATSPVRSVFDVFADSLEPPRSPLAETPPVPTEDRPRVLRHAASFTSFQAMSSPSIPCTPPPTPTEPSKPLLRRPKSSGPPQVRPAWTRPAFKPRPSLPSLNTLARTSIHVPKVRRGRPGAHLPLEPWEDPAPLAPAECEPPETQMSMFAATRSVPTSPVARRRGHIRRPTLSMIRDSRMFVDVDADADADAGAGRDGQALALDVGTEPEEKEPSSARATPTPMSMPRVLRDDDHVAGVSFLSISPDDIERGFHHSDTQEDQPPTPPPKSPSAPWHARSMSETSTTSTCTVPSLCPSSPTSTSSESAEHHHHHQYHYPAYHQHHNVHPHVHIDTAPAEHVAYPSVFSAPHIRQHTTEPDDLLHHRHTQLLTSDLIASLEYDYSEALSRLSVASGLAVPAATSSSILPSSSHFPPSSPTAGEFQPGSSAGTIRNIAHAAPRVFLAAEDEEEDEGARRRMPSDRSVDSKWSTEATDAHAHARASFLHVPMPLSPPELPSGSSSSEADTETSPAPSLAHSHSQSSSARSRSPALSPCAALSRSSSSSTVSSEYDYGDEEVEYFGCYSYDIGPFADPLASPPLPHGRRSFQQQQQQPHRPVFGYGIPWPSTHTRASGASGGSGSGSGSGGSAASVSDVLSDLEDLAEDLTERFSLSMSMRSPTASETSSYIDVDVDAHGDVLSSDEGADAGLVDGDAPSSSRRNGRPSGGSAGQGHSYARGSSSGGHGGGDRAGWFRRGSAGNGQDDEDDDGDGRKRRPARLPLSSHAAAAPTAVTESESESDEESGTDDYGADSPRRRERHDTTRPGMPAHAPLSASASQPDGVAAPADDDVPLARQIPTALRAQRTIRKQVRDELDQKRQERRAQRAQQALLAQQQQQQQQQVERSARAMSSAAEPTFPARPPMGSSPPKPVGRPRTKTLPSTMSSPFSVGDLTKKLLGLQTAPPPPPTPTTAAPVPSSAGVRSKRPSLEAHDNSQSASARGRTMAADPHARSSSSRAASRAPAADAGRSLRPTRSFHRPRTADGEAHVPPPVPASERTSFSDLQRRPTGTSRHRPDELPAFLSAPPAAPAVDARTSALDRARSVRSAKSANSAPSRRPSAERPRPEPESISASAPAPARTRLATGTPAASSSPASTFSQPVAAKGAGQMMWQQRVFIGNMQRFCLVEIGAGTSAGDVLSMVDARGALAQGAGSGGWMLWEISQDFGMERPIRSFEVLSDVCGSWNTDKTVNLLVIKKTLLAPLLSPKAMPSASPVCSGYVQWEYKRGKWQKRWMELREHSLWLSKRDTGKDATFLCSLNNFDAYYVTRVHKAPKPYVFSVKSTDSLSFFESTSDYVHVFSCGESEGKNWLEKILLARSYVLYQERNVISSSGPAGLQRSGTRKQAPGQRPAQPLVNVGAPKADPMSAPIGFEPAAGSLLARRHA